MTSVLHRTRALQPCFTQTSTVSTPSVCMAVQPNVWLIRHGALLSCRVTKHGVELYMSLANQAPDRFTGGCRPGWWCRSAALPHLGGQRRGVLFVPASSDVAADPPNQIVHCCSRCTF
eukprot:678467-Pleurochrysis_carterae.AAC.3